MSASLPLWQEVSARCQQALALPDRRRASGRRLALLVMAIITAQTTVLARLATTVVQLGLVATREPAHAARALRRALGDALLADPASYHQALAWAVDWDAFRRQEQPVLLILDESSRRDEVHLLRLALACWGTAIPLAWVVWEQNAPLPDGAYWQAIETVLAQARAVIPADLSVLVAADRAYDVPAFVDRVQGQGWHWVVRLKARSSVRFRTWQGRTVALAAVLAAALPRPGTRWKARGAVFKRAGWRPASIVGLWAVGEGEPVVVLTDLPPRWQALAWYDRRFWIEPSFRADKALGWDWEGSGVQGVAHHTRLVLAMAWATLVTASVGIAEAEAQLSRLARRHWRVRRPRGWDGRQIEHARQSILTLGQGALLRWLAGVTTDPVPVRLTGLTGPSWQHRWQQAQFARNQAHHLVRP